MDAVARDPSRDDPRETALAQALFVTFLWATSWVLIKVGLHEPALAPLTFAGLRYTLAALVLLPFAYRGLRHAGRTDGPSDTSSCSASCSLP